MSRQAVFGGAVNAEGASKPWQHLFKTGYSYGLAVTQRGAGANMSVDVAEGGAQHVTTAGVAYYGWSTATENVAVTTSNPSNPRKDILVSYIDLALITTSTVNNVNALKFLVVAGTAAASPVDPIDATIQSAVGAGNPFIKLARINVSAATSTIVNANIDDLRTPMALNTPYLWGGASNTKGHTVPNLADGTVVVTTGTGNVSTAMYADSSVTPAKLLSGTGTTWAWQSWTPTWTNLTVGNGTVAAHYSQIGKTVICTIAFTLGSTSAMGTAPVFTLPATPAARYTGTGAGASWLGAIYIEDAGSAAYQGLIMMTSTNRAQLVVYSVAGTYANSVALTAAVPFAWGTSDFFTGTFTYEAA